MAVPSNYRYTRTHEWVMIDGDIATIGITDFAQSELGDITYLELPSAGARLEREGSFGVVESVKAATDVYAPLSGEVIEGNAEAEANPELVNQSPFEQAWLIKVRISNMAELDDLLDAEAYTQFVDEQGGH